MKVSLNWVRQFTEIDISVEELVKKIGEQLGAVEEVQYLGEMYQDVVIAKVVSCEKHPNADKLSVCWIDDNGVKDDVTRSEHGHIQVVCGAPNVKEGMLVAWLPPGSTVPSTISAEPFVLEARELRGVVSNGMLASAKELAIGDEHEGILEIDVPVEPGARFTDVYQLDDYIIDIENKMFTHRPDCFGILGVAREIAGIQNKSFASPSWYLSPLSRIKPAHDGLNLQIENEITELVPRFVGLAIKDIEVKKSPVTIQSYLSRVGVKPINNIVDTTNYLMILTGQPLHAYDYDKVEQRTDAGGAILRARMGKKDEKVTLLNGKTVKVREEDIVIATDKEVVGIGGVMGGVDTEVDESTKNIIIECANFNMYAIRKTSMAHGLFTDAVTRFNKGQSALQNDTVLEEAVTMMQSLAGGEVASEVIDVRGDVQLPKAVASEAGFIQSRLGIENDANDMAQRLRNVEFGVHVHGQMLTVEPPFWRTDIEIAEDVVEEVGRLIGFDQLPTKLPERTIQPVRRNQLLELKSLIRNTLGSAGANELLTYSFVHGNLLEAVGQDTEKAFRLSNALSPDLQYYRMSLLPGLLDKVHANVKAGHKQFAIYELGKVHIKDETDAYEPTVPKEFNALAFVCINEAAKMPVYYQAKHYLGQLLPLAATKRLKYAPLKDADLSANTWLGQMAAPFEPARSAAVVDADGFIWGVVGEFSAATRKRLKLSKNVAGFEVDPTVFAAHQVNFYQPLSRYPSVQQDLSLKVDQDLSYGELEQYLADNLAEIEQTTCTLEPIDIYKKGDDKHVTFRLTIAHYEKTLKSEEVNALLDDIADKASKKFGVARL